MGISEDKIEAVRERVDIVDLIGERVHLKKAGSRYVGLCPFHHEKTGSFSVSREKSLFYCFGCHASGDIFNFVMLTDGLEFPAAVQHLAERAGVQIQPPSPADERHQKERDELTEANACALSFFERQLAEPTGQRCVRYLKNRGISSREATSRRLGFGGERGSLLEHLRQQDFPTDRAIRAGILTEDGQRSLFDGRLIFPIYSAQGALAGFGGRRLEEHAGPKYINTRESAVFEKRKLLYGFWEAIEDIRRSRCVVIVEGYTDVLAAHRAGVREAVAALGTALGQEHAKLCARLASQVVLLLDADSAGMRAALEASQLLLTAGLRVRIAGLPQGDDPDSLVNKPGGAELLQQSVAAARPAAEFFIDTTLPTQQQARSVEDRVEAAQTLAPLFACLSSGLERDLYTDRLAERVGVTAEQLRHYWSQSTGAPAHRRKQTAASSQPKSATFTPATTTPAGAPDNIPAGAPADMPADDAGPTTIELEMLRDLLLYPELRPRYPTIADYALTDAMRQLLSELADNVEASVADTLSKFVPNQRWLRRLSNVQPATKEEKGDDLASKAEQTFNDILQKLKWRHLDTALRDVIRQLREVEDDGGDTSELIRRKHGLTRQKMALRRRPAAA